MLKQLAATLLAKLAGAQEIRSNGYWLPPKQTAGVRVTHDNALAHSAVWRSVNLISDSIAIMPWAVQQKDKNGKRHELLTHPAARLLSLQPNEETDAISFRAAQLAHALTWGNGYAEIERDRSNRPHAMWQISPDRVNPVRDKSGKLWYEVSNGSAKNSYLAPDAMYHLKGLGYDGLVGYSVISYAARAIGLGLATEKFGSNLFANGANFGLTIEHPGPKALSETALTHLKESLIEQTSGDNSLSPLILEEGMKANSRSFPPNDAQFLETRKFGIAEIARWYGVPLHKLMEMDKSSFNNIESENIQFVTGSLMSWARRCEMEANIKLIAPAMRGRVTTKLNLNSLLRGDTAARGEWYQRMWGMGAYTVNRMLELEDEDPIGPDGDKRLVQLNLTTLKKVGSDEVENKVSVKEDGEAGEAAESPAAAVAVLGENTRRISSRLTHRASEALTKQGADLGGILDWLSDQRRGSESYMLDVISATLDAFNIKADLEAYIRIELDSYEREVIDAYDRNEEMFHVEHSKMLDNLLEFIL